MTISKHNNYQHYSHAGLSYFGKIVDHSDYGEGFNAMAKHLSDMPTYERMDFEDLELCGDKLLAPHDNIVDMPYYLTLEYLHKKTGVDLTLLKEYRDLLIELGADKATCMQFEGWIKIRGIEPGIEYLTMLVSELTACKPADDDYLSRKTEEEGSGSFNTISYHKVGCIYEEPEPISWIDKQPEWYQRLIETIDTTNDLDALSPLGKELYEMNLLHDQASVAFDRYNIRKSYLKSKVKLSPTAKGIVARINKANCNLGRIGAWLYKLQHQAIKIANLPSKFEWSIIWEVYRRKRAGISPAI